MRHVSTCGALPLGVGPVMLVPSVVVHHMEGHASGLDGPYPRSSQCTGRNQEGQLGDVVSAVDESLTSWDSGISNNVLLFSDIGLSLVHHYKVHRRGLPHVAFRRNYLKQLRALLPQPTVLPLARGSPDAACSTLPCAAESPDVVSASPRPSSRVFRRRQPARVMDSPVLTVQDPLAAAGELEVDCCPPLLPVSMDISGVDVSVIRASAVSAEAAAFPPEREQSLGEGEIYLV